MTVTITCADILDWAASYDGPPFHALLTDSPYHLKGGFMGRSWDANGISFQPETWAALAEHLLPGAFGMTFAGARTCHRMACAIEDAGLVLHDTIFLLWVQAQGFPKGARTHKKPTKGRERQHRWLGWAGRLGNWVERKKGNSPQYYLDFIFDGHRYGMQAIKPAIEPIIVFQKPYAGRPVDSIVATGAGALWIDGARIATGDDTGRPIGASAYQRGAGVVSFGKEGSHPLYTNNTSGHPQGRWPANLCLSHVPDHYLCQQCGSIHPMQPVIEVCPDCGGELEYREGCRRVGVKRVKGSGWNKTHREGKNPPINQVYHKWSDGFTNEGNRHADPDGFEQVDAWQCADGCPVERLGEQSGVSGPSGWRKSGPSAYGQKSGWNEHTDKCVPTAVHNDKGTAARFFHQSDWEAEGTEWACAAECPVRRLDEAAGERKSGGQKHIKREPIGEVLTSFSNYSEVSYHDVGGASRFFHNADFAAETAERLAQEDPFRYCPKAAKSERQKGLDDFYWCRDKASPSGFVRVSKAEWEGLPKKERARGNIHPTVKPLSLLSWLCRLLSPPPEYAPRRLLVPFAGSGSEVCAAITVGTFEEIVAVELLQDYVDISKARCAFWAGQSRQMELL